MTLARLAVYGAILCTLWFNGSYAYAKASGDAHQLAMVAVAITIDLCKCGFLPAASRQWTNGARVAPTVLVVLWPLAFGYSLFSGYASITTNRTVTTAATEGHVQTRARAQTDYDQATADLATAKASPLWGVTAACTAIKTVAHRQYCDGIGRTSDTQQTAANLLNGSQPTHVDPEVSLIAALTGLPMSGLLLVVAFAPALILELMSSLGYYAVNRAPPRDPQKLAEGSARRWQSLWHTNRENASTGHPEASANPSTVIPAVNGATSPKVTTWKVQPSP